MIDYNEPNLENIFRMIKEMHSKVCPWGECTGCGKKMQDKGYGYTCFDCKENKKENNVPDGF
jgi:tRNA(Ile2) C34 agmatinyltransferase TiaS